VVGITVQIFTVNITRNCKYQSWEYIEELGNELKKTSN
jgi:hypothetical protein